MEWIGGIDWAWWAGAAWSFGWPVIVATPGLIAFWWQWNDRKEAQEPFVTAFPSKDFPEPKRDWLPIQFFVRNTLPFAIDITEVRITGPKGVVLFMDYTAPSRRGKPTTGSPPSDTVTVKWTLPAGADTGTVFIGHHGRELLAYVGSTAESVSNARLSISCSFRKQSADLRIRKTQAISAEMQINKVTI